MYLLALIIRCIVGLLAHFSIVYVSYQLAARKYCTESSLLKAAGVVTLIAALVTTATNMLEQNLPVDLAAALLLTYYCGRRILKTGRWSALFAALIYGGIVLTLGIILTLCIDL